MKAGPNVETRSPPPAPLFLLAQNLNPKDIARSDASIMCNQLMKTGVRVTTVDPHHGELHKGGHNVAS